MEIQSVLRQSDGDGWTLVAGCASSEEADRVHEGSRSTPALQACAAASASKWVAATVVLAQVDAGALCLGDHPQRWLGPGWASDGLGGPAGDARGEVTLADLLSFTSGQLPLAQGVAPVWSDSPGAGLLPLTQPVMEVAAAQPVLFCAQRLRRECSYQGFNLECAGAMAEIAASAPWAALYERTVGSQAAAHSGWAPTAEALADLGFAASAAGPLAGGCTISPAGYAAFLRQLLRGGLLRPATLNAMATAHGHTAMAWGAGLPAASGLQPASRGGWERGYGVWVEAPGIISSLGFNGFYPKADLRSGTYAVLFPGGPLATERAAAATGVFMARAAALMSLLWPRLQLMFDDDCG